MGAPQVTHQYLEYLGAASARSIATLSSVPRAEPVTWLGAASFESRSTGAIARFAETGQRPAAVHLIQYETTVKPRAEERRLQDLNLELITASSAPAQVTFHPVDPYSFYDLQDVIDSVCATSPNLVVDITCLTKIHTIALAARLSLLQCAIHVAYTVPNNYSLPERTAGRGWRDRVIAPLMESGEDIAGEEAARGIILPGHEPDRLVVALSELEPVAGVIVMAESRERPDLRDDAEKRNKRVISYLTGVHRQAWRKVHVSTTDVTVVAGLVAGEVEAGGPLAPTILYPFGPKPLVLASAHALAALNPGRSWFVYPIPWEYDVHVTEGIGSTHWFRLNVT